MADSDKINHRIDPGGNPAESKKSVSQTPSGATEKSVAEEDAEWGYEPKKGGMATEAKMGMGIVAILLCAFGFLVYTKFDLKQKAIDLATAAQGQSKGPPAASDDIDPQNRYSEFEPTSEQTVATALRDAEVASDRSRVTAPPVFSGLAEPAVATTPESTFAFNDNTKPSTDVESKFELKEPVDAFEPVVSTDARDVLAAREQTTVPTAKATPVDFGFPPTESKTLRETPAAEPAATFDSFADAGFGTPSTTESESALPRTPLAARDSDKILLEPTFDEPAVAVFSAPIEPEMKSSFDDKKRVAQAPAFDDFPAFTDLPPASDIDDANTVKEENSIVAVKTLPSVAAAAATAQSDDNTRTFAAVEEFKPLASIEPVSPPAFDDEPVVSMFDAEDTRTADVAKAEPTEQPDPFSRFSAEPEPAIDDSPSVRRSAPMPEFPIADVTPAPAAVKSLSEEFPADLRRDTLVAMTSPAPDVEVFGQSEFAPTPQERVAPAQRQAPSISQDPSTTDTRHFGSKSSSVFGEFDSDSKASTLAQPKSKPEPSVFAGFDPPPSLAIPRHNMKTNQEREGVAHFAAPVATGIQQVSGISQECDICEVKDNDSYWNISKRAYGTARYFSSLALYNKERIPDPRKLRPGMKVLIPDPKLLEKKYPEFFRDQKTGAKKAAGYFVQSNGSPAYRIGERETLSAISQRHLGRASRWIQIYRMNQHILKDPNKLKLGTVIALPNDATDVHLAP